MDHKYDMMLRHIWHVGTHNGFFEI